jgi:lambda repressor-like predicted transcriptional regulator
MIKPTDIPTSFHERGLWVSMQLKLRGTSLAKLARSKGWSKQTMYFAMRSPSFPQEEVIAKALDLTVPELFPERYDILGNRIHSIRSKSDHASRGNGEGLAVA